ncbi:MAG: redoxin domain-containing protein [Phycisphaera sp.]|nr:redoxin domain-containing protein [Phycisphaera sp.]
MAVQVGSPAPKFKAQAYLRSSDEFKEIKLEDYKGKWLYFYFYPMDFTFVCPTEIKAFDDALGEFQDRDCEILTCSTDSHFVHKGWCEAKDELKNLKHPMLADITKRVSMDFGVLLPEKGVALRGSFIIDPDGIVRWTNINDLPVGRNVEEVLRVLDALQTNELCPCNWKKGEETLKV